MVNEKILIIGPVAPPRGGIATYVDEMLISDLANDYTLLHLNTARSHEIKKSLIRNILLFTINIFKLIQILYIEKPKLIHIHTSSYSAFWEKSVFLTVSKLFSRKVILHIHGAKFDQFYINSNNFSKIIIKSVLNLSDNLIVLSQSWKCFFEHLVIADKIVVVPNGINSQKFKVFEDRLVNDNDKVQILFLGNLVERKGVYDILCSIPIVLNEFKNVHFVFAGAEENLGEINRLKNECINKGVDKYVTFETNFSDEKKIKLLLESDIYILPSYAEGLPISLLEAMASGLPVISTPVGGIPEVITEGINGFLIAPGDCIGLANRIIELVKNSELREIISQNNKEKVRTKYDWKIVANNIFNVYDELLEYQNNS